MTEKTRTKLDNFILENPEEYRGFVKELAEYAISLGYNPKFQKNISCVDFIKSKNGRTIMKIYANCNPHGLASDGKPHLRIRFDGLPICTGLFEEAAKLCHSVCMAHCNSQSNCNRANAIKYTLSDNSVVLGTCQQIRDIPKYNIEDLPLIKESLKIQDAYLMELYAT